MVTRHLTLGPQHCENCDVKQFTVTREMLTAVACDQSVRAVEGGLKVRGVAGFSARFSKFAFVSFCYRTVVSLERISTRSLFLFLKSSARGTQNILCKLGIRATWPEGNNIQAVMQN